MSINTNVLGHDLALVVAHLLGENVHTLGATVVVALGHVTATEGPCLHTLTLYNNFYISSRSRSPYRRRSYSPYRKRGWRSRSTSRSPMSNRRRHIGNRVRPSY